jgi:hypothetical protein
MRSKQRKAVNLPPSYVGVGRPVLGAVRTVRSLPIAHERGEVTIDGFDGSMRS